MSNSQQTIATLKWLLPTGLELIGYTAISLATIVASNFTSVEQLLLLPGDFNFQEAILNSIGTILDQILGATASSSLVLGIFWALVGVVVYIVLWLSSNFSAEISTDLAERKYIHPRGSDPNHALKAFLEHSLFRLATTIFLLFYISTFIQVLFPMWTTAYKDMVQHWLSLGFVRTAAFMLIVQVCAMHAIAVLFRLALLRKRVFGSYLP